jgi:hypothetical protein
MLGNPANKYRPSDGALPGVDRFRDAAHKSARCFAAPLQGFGPRCNVIAGLLPGIAPNHRSLERTAPGSIFEEHQHSHRSDTFQPLFRDVLELCDSGNEEIANEMLWSGRAYSEEEALAAREAKVRYAA